MSYKCLFCKKKLETLNSYKKHLHKEKDFIKLLDISNRFDDIDKKFFISFIKQNKRIEIINYLKKKYKLSEKEIHLISIHNLSITLNFY
jgi:hypothetical protein